MGARTSRQGCRDAARHGAHLIEAGTIDEPFLVNYTNAPDLVGEDGKVLKSTDGKSSLVWDTVTNSAKPFTAEVKPALKGSYTVDGKPIRTAFQVFADSVKDITPQYAEEFPACRRRRSCAWRRPSRRRRASARRS